MPGKISTVLGNSNLRVVLKEPKLPQVLQERSGKLLMWQGSTLFASRSTGDACFHAPHVSRLLAAL